MQMFRHCLFVGAIALSTAATLSVHAAKDEPVNLLRLSTAKIEWATVPGGDLSGLGALTDGDPKTITVESATDTEPLDIVYGFNGNTVAPESVRVTLPDKGQSDASAGRVEILVSTVSARTGFHSVRADPLNPTSRQQTFDFPPIAAQWILVRLAPSPGNQHVAAAEIEVFGREGMPKSQYKFAETPARAFDVLARLEKTSFLNVSITDDEKSIFAKVQAGRLDLASFADAALLASGVLDPIKRKFYLKRIDMLEQDARSAVARGRTPSEKAEALLRWLHKGPLAKGYKSEQTDLSVLLDTGTFNCVSSATIYNILALRLGLDVRAIEVPDHAFSVLYENTNHADVETTNAIGFGPARDPRAVQHFEQMTGFRYIPDTYRDQRREIEEAGLVALIYYNHGVMLTKQGRHYEALLSFFRAMSLDGEFSSAVKNALVVLANWSGELARHKEWEEALAIAATGLALAPNDAALVNNRTAIWTAWAESAIDAGQSENAIAILKRAASEVPKGGFVAMQAWVYIRPGERLVKARQWEEALALAETGFAKLDANPGSELTKWRHDLYLRWFNAEVDARDFDAAVTVISRGLVETPADRRLQNSAGYLAQEWAKETASRAGYAEALVVLRRLKDRFRGIEFVTDAATSYVRQTVYGYADAGKIDDALAALEQARDVLPGAKEERDIAVYTYDTWARMHMRAGEWDRAADAYAGGLARFPSDALLNNNVGFLAQEWLKAVLARDGSNAIAEVTKVLVAKFPAMTTTMIECGRDQIRREVGERVKAGKYEEAFKLAEDSKALFDSAEINRLDEIVYDSWAKKQIAAKEWEAAADLYATALERVGTSSLLRNNVEYLAQEWARAVYAKGGPEAVAEVTKLLVAKFPGIESVSASGAPVVIGAVNEQVRNGNFETALSILENGSILLKSGQERELYEFIYDRWARRSVDKGDWDNAIRVYDQGLERIPDDALFRQNRAYSSKQRDDAIHKSQGSVYPANR